MTEQMCKKIISPLVKMMKPLKKLNSLTEGQTLMRVTQCARLHSSTTKMCFCACGAHSAIYVGAVSHAFQKARNGKDKYFQKEDIY